MWNDRMCMSLLIIVESPYGSPCTLLPEVCTAQIGSKAPLLLVAFGACNTGMLPCQRKSSLGVMIERKQMPSFCSMTAIAGRFPRQRKLSVMWFFVAAFTRGGSIEKIAMFIGRTRSNYRMTFSTFELYMFPRNGNFVLSWENNSRSQACAV